MFKYLFRALYYMLKESNELSSFKDDNVVLKIKNVIKHFGLYNGQIPELLETDQLPAILFELVSSNYKPIRQREQLAEIEFKLHIILDSKPIGTEGLLNFDESSLIQIGLMDDVLRIVSTMDYRSLPTYYSDNGTHDTVYYKSDFDIENLTTASEETIELSKLQKRFVITGVSNDIKLETAPYTDKTTDHTENRINTLTFRCYINSIGCYEVAQQAWSKNVNYLAGTKISVPVKSEDTNEVVNTIYISTKAITFIAEDKANNIPEDTFEIQLARGDWKLFENTSSKEGTNAANNKGSNTLAPFKAGKDEGYILNK